MRLNTADAHAETPFLASPASSLIGEESLIIREDRLHHFDGTGFARSGEIAEPADIPMQWRDAAHAMQFMQSSCCNPAGAIHQLIRETT